MSFLEDESTFLSFDVDGLEEYFDVCNLRMFHFGVQGSRLGVVTLRHLLVMQGCSATSTSIISTSTSDAAYANSVVEEHNQKQQNIQIASFVPEYGYPMCLQWLVNGVLAVGFDSGYLVCFDENASTISENKFDESALVSFQIDYATTTDVVWLLFEKGNCICVSAILVAS